MNEAFLAMTFARQAHAAQVRKYTGEPYWVHLSEVAGIVSTVRSDANVIATAWLHDCMEDCGVRYEELLLEFGSQIAEGVRWLSDMEQGNRAARKAASRERLGKAPGWVQDIKVADLISNTASIAKHDPTFSVVYLEEKRLLLGVLTRADERLLNIARQQAEA